MIKLINKYLVVLILFLFLINLLRYIETSMGVLPFFSSNRFSYDILRLLFGVIFLVMILFDRRRIKYVSTLLIVLILGLVLLDYFSGSILFMIAALASKQKEMSLIDHVKEDNIIDHLVSSKKEE